MQEIHFKKNNIGEIKYFATKLKDDITKENIQRMAILFRGAKIKASSITPTNKIISPYTIQNKKLRQDLNESLYEIKSYITIYLVSKIPNGCIRYTYPLMSVKEYKGGISTYELATKNIAGEETINNTNYANHQQLLSNEEELKQLNNEVE